MNGIEEARPLPQPYGWLSLAGVVLGSVLTVAYTARFMWGAFASKPGVPPTRLKMPHPGFVAAPLALGVGSLLARPDGADRVHVAHAVCRPVPHG